MPRINKTQFAILGCLSIEPMSAYDIKAFMARSTGHFWKEYEPQLYPTLKMLVEQQAVTVTEKKATKKGMCKIYEMTDIGLDHLTHWLSLPPEKATYRNEFLLKLFFGNNTPVQTSLNHIEQHENDLLNELNVLQTIAARINHGKPSKRKVYVECCLEYGIMLIQTEIAWCHKAKTMLNNINGVTT